MEIEQDKKNEISERDKGYIRMRSIMDIGMGALWMSMGVFLAFIKYFNTDLIDRLDNPVMRIFGCVCIFYGIFRIYRGFRKNYYS